MSADPPQDEAPDVLIQISRLVKRPALDGIDLTVGSGVTALLAPQGAGKTALFRVVLGIERPDSGDVLVLNLPVPKRAVQVRAEVGYLPQRYAAYETMNAARLAGFLSELYPRWDGGRFYELIGRQRIAAGSRIEQLTPLQRARVSLAAALAPKPQLLLVDVPGDLDALGRSELLRWVQEERGDIPLVVASSRPREVARWVGRVAVLAQGTIRWAGAPRDLIATTRRLRVPADQDRPELPPGVELLSSWTPGQGQPRDLWLRGPQEVVAQLPGAETVDLEEAYLALVRASSGPGGADHHLTHPAQDQQPAVG